MSADQTIPSDASHPSPIADAVIPDAPAPSDAPVPLVDADPAEIAARRARRRAAEHQQHITKLRAAIRASADAVVAHRAQRWAALPLRITVAPECERVRIGIAGSLAPAPDAGSMARLRAERIDIVRRVYARLASADTITPGALDVLIDELIDEAQRRPGAFADIALGADGHAPSDDLADHAFAVGALSLGIAIALGWSRPAIRAAAMSGFLAEVGLTLAPHDVRHIAGPLSEVELNALHRHPAWSAGLLELIKARTVDEALPEAVQIAVYQHHERLDGSGYPARIRADRIHDLARIVAVADVLAGLCAPRAHRPALSREQALTALARQASVGMLDRAATRAAVAVIGQSAVRAAPNVAAARAA